MQEVVLVKESQYGGTSNPSRARNAMMRAETAYSGAVQVCPADDWAYHAHTGYHVLSTPRAVVSLAWTKGREEVEG